MWVSFQVQPIGSSHTNRYNTAFKFLLLACLRYLLAFKKAIIKVSVGYCAMIFWRRGVGGIECNTICCQFPTKDRVGNIEICQILALYRFIKKTRSKK